MEDFEERVRRGLATVARTVPVGEPGRGTHRRRAERMAVLAVAAVVLAIAVPLGVVGAMHDGETPVGPADQPTSSSHSPSSNRTDSPPTSPTQVAVTDDVVPPRIRVLVQQIEARDVIPASVFGVIPENDLYLCQMLIYGNSGPHTIYAAVLCGTWSTGSQASSKSSTLLDMVLTVDGSGASTRLLGFQTPRQDHLQQDYRRLFPTRILTLMRQNQIGTSSGVLLPTEDQLLTVARNDASTQ